MQTRRSVKRKRDAEAAQELLPKVLEILVQNAVIGASSLGALGQTNKKHHRFARSNYAWAPLCIHMWPNTASVPKAVISRQGGFRAFFKHRYYSATQPVFGKPSKLAPPSVTANDLMLLIDFQKKGKSLYSTSITGDELLPLLKNGEMRHVTKESAVVLGDVEQRGEAGIDGEIDFGPVGYNGEDYDVSIQLVRLNDSHTCCLFSPTIRWPDFEPPSAPLLKNYGHQKLVDLKNQRFGYLDFGDGVYDKKKGLPLRSSDAAGAIRCRFNDPFGFKITPKLYIAPGKELSGMGEKQHALVIEVICFEIEAVKYVGEDFLEAETFDSEKEDVSLLHLLAEVQGLFLTP
jgi:hypothetical protein